MLLGWSAFPPPSPVPSLPLPKPCPPADLHGSDLPLAASGGCYLPAEFRMNGITQYLLFGVWLLSLNLTSTRFFSAVFTSSFSFMLLNTFVEVDVGLFIAGEESCMNIYSPGIHFYYS